MKRNAKHSLILIPKVRIDGKIQRYWKLPFKKETKSVASTEKEVNTAKDIKNKVEKAHIKIRKNIPLDAEEVYLIGINDVGFSSSRKFASFLDKLKKAKEKLIDSVRGFVMSNADTKVSKLQIEYTKLAQKYAKEGKLSKEEEELYQLLDRALNRMLTPEEKEKIERLQAKWRKQREDAKASGKKPPKINEDELTPLEKIAYWSKKRVSVKPEFLYKVKLGEGKSKVLENLNPIYVHRLHKGGAITDDEVRNIALDLITTTLNTLSKEGYGDLPDVILAPPITIRHPADNEGNIDYSRLTGEAVDDINRSFAHRLAKQMSDLMSRGVALTDNVKAYLNKHGKFRELEFFKRYKDLLNDKDTASLLSDAKTDEDFEQLGEWLGISGEKLKKFKEYKADLADIKNDFEFATSLKELGLLSSKDEIEFFHDVMDTLIQSKNKGLLDEAFNKPSTSKKYLTFNPVFDPLILGHKGFQVKELRGRTPEEYAKTMLGLSDDDLKTNKFYLEGDEDLKQDITDYIKQKYGGVKERDNIDTVLKTASAYLMYRYWLNHHVLPYLTGKPPAKSVREFNSRLRDVLDNARSVWIVDDNVDSGATFTALSILFRTAGYNNVNVSPLSIRSATGGLPHQQIRMYKEVGKKLYDQMDPKLREALLSPEDAKLKPRPLER